MSTSHPLSPPSTTSRPPTSSTSSNGSFALSPSPVIPIHLAAQQQQYPIVTHKSHRLRTSPVPAEGSTLVPVVKFSQSFTQRNALRATKPLYPPSTTLQDPSTSHGGVQGVDEREPVARPRVPGTAGDGRTAGWTISITTSSSNHTSTPPAATDEENQYQVEIQQHFEPPPSLPSTSHQYREQGRLLGGAGPPLLTEIEPPVNRTIVPRYVPTLGHDRVVLTEEDYSRIRIRAIALLTLGLLFPPLLVLMGFSHVVDSAILPRVFGMQREAVAGVYRPFRVVAAVMGGVVLVGTVVGVILGALALGGVIV
jgi:hypothetical protein